MGNQNGIMGFDHRIVPPALPVPTTVMKRSIGDYVSNPQNILAILMKKQGESYYNKVIGSVSKGIKVEELPDTISKKIDKSIECIISKKEER